MKEQEVSRFNDRNIRRSEFMYGDGWQSPGGVEIVEAFAARLRLSPGKKMLDVGSGLGGALFHLAHNYGMTGVGVDYAQAMVDISQRRSAQQGFNGEIRFMQGDITQVEVPEEDFDLVWSRDAILYCPDKGAVWKVAYDALGPGGELFVTDFLRGDGERRPSFEQYLEDCGYHLQTFDQYQAGLEAAGFSNVDSENITPEFIRYLKEDIRRLESREAEFLVEFDQADFDYLVSRWEGKIRMCLEGDLHWGLHRADK